MAKKRKDIKEFEHIGGVINKILKTCRHESDEELVKVWNLWNSAVGDVVSENARPAAFKGRLLIVHVVSSTWIHQLQFLKTDIIERLNDAFGKDMVGEIKFKIGPLS
ncbi:MAG: DUF721 domain-containing protein [Desulfobacterales bacterium]|nr:DUF721 domain-containing protein [Desulfobacterales bacterium]